VAIHVYRVVQEALSNVARHSGVERAWVRLRFSSDRLILEIEDHGKGISLDRTTHGLGLVAMRERAAIVGGTIEFLHPAAGGTLVRLAIPIAPIADAAAKEGAHARAG